MIYNAKVVIPVLLLFVGLLTYPLWQGGTNERPELQKPAKGTHCVESAEWMRANHMQLLDQWRHEVVREQKRTYTSTTGETYNKSLSETCLDCHQSKEQFCDQCHEYASVKLVCFNCHLNPEDLEQ